MKGAYYNQSVLLDLWSLLLVSLVLELVLEASNQFDRTKRLQPCFVLKIRVLKAVQCSTFSDIQTVFEMCKSWFFFFL